MNRNSALIASAGVLLVISLSAFAYNSTKHDTIPEGVSVGGVDISGQPRYKAELTLQRELQAPLLKPVDVVYEGKTRRLTAAGAGINVDIDGMIDEAIDRGNSGFFVVTAVKRALGVDRNVSVATKIDYSREALRNFIGRTKQIFNRKAQDATVKFGPKDLGQVDGQTGVKIKTPRLRAAIIAAFTSPEAPHEIPLPAKITKPKVTRKQLAHKFPVAITIDRENFRLHLFKKLRRSKTYKIAVGQVGLETPAGLYAIHNKQTNPSWHVPNSSWAGKLAGKVIPPGPTNPIQARWLGIYDGVGIHGTTDVSSLGSAASHGCIRMAPKDVIELYPHVPINTPVYIG